MPSEYPLPSSDLASLGFAAKPLEHLDALIQPAYRGRPLSRRADRAGPARQAGVVPHLRQRQGRADESSRRQRLRCSCCFSQTKVLTSSAVWTLVEEGKLSFMDKVSDHLPEFAARGKADITLEQVMTHQGGFPNNNVTQGDLDRPCAHARRGLRLLARLDARFEAAIPRPGRTPGAGDGDRGGHRPGLSRRDPHAGDRAAGPRQRHLRRRADAAAEPLRRHLRAGTARQFARVPCCGFAERRRFRHGARHGGVLSDARPRRAAGQRAAVLAAADRLRLAQPHRRAAATRRWMAFRCIAAWVRMCAARAIASAAWARSARR